VYVAINCFFVMMWTVVLERGGGGVGKLLTSDVKLSFFYAILT